MFKKITSPLSNKKGASFMELILIVGALALITSFGLQMFKQQANKSGVNFQSNVTQAEQNILK